MNNFENGNVGKWEGGKWEGGKMETWKMATWKIGMWKMGRWKNEKVGEEEIRKQEMGIFKQAVEDEQQNGLMSQKRCEGMKVSERETAGE